MSNPPRNIPSNISIAGDVSNSAVVLGNDNNVTINVEYRPFVDKFLGRMADLTEYFVGREFLDSELEKFLENNECGYFTLIGEPGIGKSAWAAHVIQTQKAVYHFCEHGHEITNTLSNLAVQISQLFNIPAEFPPSSAPAFTQYFSKVIYEASLQLEGKLVIVIDSLDQLDVSAINTGANILLLPESLPKGVFIVTTTRPPAPHLIVAPEIAKAQYIISGSDQTNQTDAMKFIREKLDSEPYTLYTQSQNISIDAFANALLEQSAGNFMYLRAQFIALKDPERFAAGIEGLPLGLHDYYEQFWHSLEHEIHNEKIWEETKSIFGILAVVYDSVDADWISVINKQDAKQVSKIFEKHIAEFLTRESKEKKPFWKIYHQSFRDFLAEKLGDLTLYHRQIVDYYRGIDFSTAPIKEVAYGVRNFVKHLEILGEKDEIFRLVTANEKQPVWVNAHYALSGEYSGYLRDLNKAWSFAENEDTWDIGRQLHCAIILLSLQLLSSNIPLSLMIQAIKHKFWTPEIAIEYIKAMPANAERVSTLFEIWQHLDIDKDPLWKMAVGWAFDIVDEDEQGLALQELFSFLMESDGRITILEHLQRFHDIPTRVKNLVMLYPKLTEGEKERVNEWLWKNLVEIKDEIGNEVLNAFLGASSVHPKRGEILSAWRDRVEALTDATNKIDWLSQSASLYEAEERSNLVSQLLQNIEESRDLALKEKVLQRLIPFLSEQGVRKAIEINRGFRKAEIRNKVLVLLAAHSPEKAKQVVLDEVMHIQPQKDRLDLLVKIVDFMPGELFSVIWEQFKFAISKSKDLLETLPVFAEKLTRDQQLQVFELSKQVKPENERAELLARIAILLGVEFLTQVLEELHQIKDHGYYFRAIGWLACFMPIESEDQIFLAVQKKYEDQSIRTLNNSITIILNFSDTHLRAEKNIWFLIEFYAQSDDVKVILLSRSKAQLLWKSYLEKYESKSYTTSLFNRYLHEQENLLFETLKFLSEADRSYLLQALLWGTQHFGAYNWKLDSALDDYKKFKTKKHIIKTDYSIDGIILKISGTDDLTLSNLVGEDSTKRLTNDLQNAKTYWDLLKTFAQPLFKRPDLHKPEFLYKAIVAISLKPDHRYQYESIAAIWRKIKFVGIRQDKKTWGQVIRTSASRDLDEFLEDLRYLAPLLIEAGGQKAIQETYEALRDVKTWWAQSLY